MIHRRYLLLAGLLVLAAAPVRPTHAAVPTDTPIGLQVFPGPGALLLTFGTVPGATGYTVYRRAATDAADTAAKVSGDSPIVYGWFIDDKGLTNGVNYVYTVKAVKGGTEGPASAETIGMPQVPIGDGYLL